MKLIRTHIGRIRKELADQDLARIDRAGTDTIHFEWSGGLAPGEPHHYLIQGKTFLIEYDNTQDNANHVHTVYRDFDNDFGDALLRHYQREHQQATTQASARPALKEIELHYGVYLARYEQRITVSPEGALRSVRTDGKSYGPKDVDPNFERVEVREGQLTAEQMIDLSRRFADWSSFSSEPYTGHPDGGGVSIRYGNKTVSGGDLVPKQVEDIRVQLMELARAMPIVKS
jgi:hypothetical protein